MSTVATSPKAGANPTKAFFVTMITRDITLEDCILDLIDNSVDGAWRCEGSRPMGLADDADLSKYSIFIDASSERFRIGDNCGGMTLDDAINHAFSFGRRAMDTYADYSIGVYGIGMKRAVFKLGKDIRIRSTYQEDGKRESFAVPIVPQPGIVRHLARNEDNFGRDRCRPYCENATTSGANWWLGQAGTGLTADTAPMPGSRGLLPSRDCHFLAPQIRDGFQPERVSKSVPIGVSMTNGVGNEKPSMISQKWGMIRVGGAWLYGARLRANWEPIS